MRAARVTAVILFSASMAVAQTKVSGTAQCRSAGPAESMDVADRPNHSFGIAQGKCTWTKPLEIEGAKSKDDVYTAFAELTGDQLRIEGYVTTTMDSGDKYSTRIRGVQTLKDGKTVSERGQWTFTSGTGKLKGIKGKGTYEAKPEADHMVATVEGEYQLPK
jgi:hypothetical protein